MHRKISLPFVLLNPFVAAQYPITTSMLFLDTDPEPLIGSIIAISDSTTTYSIFCALGTDSSDCGIGEGATITIAPSVYDFYIAEFSIDADAFAMSVHCQLSGTMPSSCTVSAGGHDANEPGVATVTPVASPAAGDHNGYTYLPITITAGPVYGAVPVPVPDTSAVPTVTTALSLISDDGSSENATAVANTSIPSAESSATTTTTESVITATSNTSAASYTGEACQSLPSGLVAAVGGILGALILA